MRNANLIQPVARKDWARGGCAGAKSRRPDELKGIKPVLADGVREVRDSPVFSVRYERAVELSFSNE